MDPSQRLARYTAKTTTKSVLVSIRLEDFELKQYAYLKEYLLNTRKQRFEWLVSRLKETKSTISSVRLISKKMVQVEKEHKTELKSDRNSISAILP